MPQIIVTADRGTAFAEGAVTLRERVNVADFESQHFATQLVERLGWAVEDAVQAEQKKDTSERRRGVRDRRREAPEPTRDETAYDVAEPLAEEPVPVHASV
jgi:hypothetical protein